VFIIAGTKVRRTPLGRVADFCGLCREIRPFRVTEVREVAHLYYIPLGRGDVKHYEFICAGCREQRTGDLSPYADVVSSDVEELDILIEATNPEVTRHAIELLEAEDRVARDEATAEERRLVLMQPLLAINPAVEARVSQVHVDARSLLLMIAMIVFPLALVLPGAVLWPSTPGEILVYSGAAAGVVLLGMLLQSLATDPGRFVRRRYREFLAESLAAYRPTPDEVRDIMRELRDRRLAVGKRVSPAWLWQEIERYETRSA